MNSKTLRRSVEVWYDKNPSFRSDDKLLSVNKLSDTHVRLQNYVNITVPSHYSDIDICEEIFYNMQGENWSPNGEANGLIESLGLGHTSMSIGDVTVIDGIGYMCDSIGWKIL